MYDHQWINQPFTAFIKIECSYAFSSAVIAILRGYHKKGMVGTGRDYHDSTNVAANEVGLNMSK